MSNLVKIGEVAARCGVTTRTLRAIDTELRDLGEWRTVVVAVLGRLRKRGFQPVEAVLEALPSLASAAVPNPG